MNKRKPCIRIIGTGGTISYNPKDHEDEMRQTARFMDVGFILRGFPHMEDAAEISSEDLFNIGSTGISEHHWLTLAARVSEVLREYDGVVITHGTDTMEETAFFLNLVLKSDKPVVLTGAMRNAAAVSADGLQNVINAVLLAADERSRGKGVLVCMDELIFAARDVMKKNTHLMSAFAGTEYGCLGKVMHDTVFWNYAPLRPHTLQSEFDIVGVERLPRVEIVYGYSDCGDRLIRLLAADGAEGIVYACTGSGILHPDVRALYEREHGHLPILVRSSRIPDGGSMENIHINDDLYGTVSSYDLSPQKARILLKLALHKTHSRQEIRDIFRRY